MRSFPATFRYENALAVAEGDCTNDWVVLYFHEDHGPEGQATIVTEPRGRLRGRRVVRGRERECAELLEDEPEAARQAG